MATEWTSVVWRLAPCGGAKLLVLLAQADEADENGLSTVSIERLAHRARLTERRVQQVRQELVDEHLLEFVSSGGGRGRPSTFRLLFQVEKGEATCTVSKRKRVKPSSPLAEKKGEADCTLSKETLHGASPFFEKGEAGFTLLAEKGEADCTLSLKGEEDCTLSRPETPKPDSPFPPARVEEDLLVPPEEEASPSPSSLSSGEAKRLTEHQASVSTILGLLAAAGIEPWPSPSSIGKWLSMIANRVDAPEKETVKEVTKVLRALLDELIGQDLASKSKPAAYIYACVAARSKDGPGRRALPPTLSAGADAGRRDQARRISAASRRRAPE